MATCDEVNNCSAQASVLETDDETPVEDVAAHALPKTTNINVADDFQDDGTWNFVSRGSHNSCASVSAFSFQTRQHETEEIVNACKQLKQASIDESDVNSRVTSPMCAETPEELKQNRSTKRFHILKELINTEGDFLKNLNIIIDDIMITLSERKLPVEIKVERLFSNIKDVRNFSVSFMVSLEKLECSIYQESPDKMNVGRVFINHIPQMIDVYKVYCRNYNDAINELEKLKNEPEILFEFLNNVRSKVKTVDLASFLIQPVQRVLKYPLFLHELLKLIDPMELPADSTYYRDLMAALKLMEHVARLINEETRKKDLSITF